MSLLKSIGVTITQSALAVSVFLLTQPIFFEFFRRAQPNDSTTLILLFLGIILATLAGCLVFLTVYRKQLKKSIEILGISLYFTISSFLIVSYFKLFTTGLWTYPWWQLLSLAISAPNYFWLFWCLVFSVFCAVFSNIYKLEQQVIQ